MVYTAQAFFIPLVVICGALALADYLLKPELYDSSAELIELIQETRFYLGDIFFKGFSEFVLALFAVVPLCRYFLVSHSKGLREFTLTMLAVYVSNVLKIVYSDPRPYWKYAEVAAVKCETSWGNPSGHALMSACFVSYYVYKYNQRTNDISLNLTCVASLAFILLVGYDRLYLGAHFYSQLLLGWAFGFLITAGFLAYEDSVKIIIKATKSDKLAVLVWLFIGALALLTSVVIAGLRSYNIDMLWSANVTLKCGTPTVVLNATKSAFIESAYIVLPPAFAIGLYIARNSEFGSVSEKLNSRLVKLSVVLSVTAVVYGLHYYILGVIESPWVGFAISIVYYGCAGILASFSGERYFTHHSKEQALLDSLIKKVA